MNSEILCYPIGCASFALDRALLGEQIQQVREPKFGFERFDLLKFCAYS
jgi:hypothetical protein